ncbi:quinone-dependent dihydroorotate dehydrogenase [Moritella viscosa]|uniref:Dihydroorotate dehydrogenase (quinone) n=2 Tax=Moritella viscosa TaxID=80854 RepID=A0ABY1HFY0_9GAMM|nr:dihydroorotate dehydrogenase [Moritella viscosa]SGY95185.1 Dihydroorotate dehydrogenase 2 [Moritella viscosa]SGZ00508.1 Dihydroorotate dehydrogenase 2 [Moritella viscosa]SGZ00932.1 Dihydroorotate dehydrogenase 2 [Moritella viscosa]SGZ07159.1 Dihydroorotate dehydrogenase 2 [Moritella viscosa]
MSAIVGLRNYILKILYRIFRPIIFLMDPEQAHYALKKIGVFLGSNVITRLITGLLFNYSHKSLNTEVDGVKYRNPVGLSAGFDKDGELTKIYPYLGFGLAELGSFTGEICPGNPGKRLFRMVKSKSIVVWYGLNNLGAEKISARLADADFGDLRIGINAAKSNVSPDFVLAESIRDYLKTMTLFKDIGDYYTINISCPNTQDGEPFVDADNLGALLAAVNENIRPISDKPIYVKLAADLTFDEIDVIVDGCIEYKMDGFVLTNLAKPGCNQEHISAEYPSKLGLLPEGKGAMSGLPLQRISTNVIRHVYRRTRGELTIIGVGGIFTAKDAYEKITSGANLLHMITTMIFDGPQNISEINRGLVKLLKADGFTSIEQAVGSRNPLPELVIPEAIEEVAEVA